MKKLFLLLLFLPLLSEAQTRLVVIGSSTAAGVGASVYDSSWVGRSNRYFKYQLGITDTVHNLGVSGTTNYHGMPTTYVPPPGRPAPDPLHNVSRAVSLLAGLGSSTDGVTIVNFPSNGYDTYSIEEILSSLQVIYDSAVQGGNRCYIVTPQPRSSGAFGTPAIRLKMAILKDSIVNRFGVANTLNFWDGMYNPADTTILAMYDADGTHFNNAGHRVLFDRVVAKNIFNLPPPAVGDYRSNVTTTGIWSDVSSWQTWNGSAWVAAGGTPTSAAGTVTIVTGDSIRVNNAVAVDQVVVENGAILAFFNTSTPTTFTLDDNTGADIINNGKLYVSAGGTLTGTGSIQNNIGGVFILRNQGVLQVNAVNNGIMQVSGTGNVQNATVTNNKTFVQQDFTLNLNNATLINNDSLAITASANTFIATTTGTGTLTNAASAVIHKVNSAGIMQINSTVSVTNSGRIRGQGQYVITTVAANTGTIAPGNSPGILTVNPAFITGKTPIVNLEISSTGAVAGTNYDQLNFSVVNFLNTNITGVALNLSNTATDPIGTTYTLMSSPSGSITGPFQSVSMPLNFGNLIYTANGVTVQKTAPDPLPLNWGDFTVRKSGQQALLYWQTLQGREADHFIAEHSMDGQRFSAAGIIKARENGTDRTDYMFRHPAPEAGRTNFYRIRMVERNGSISYSPTRSLLFAPEASFPVQVAPNPAHDLVALTVQAEADVRLCDLTGRELRRWQLTEGKHLVPVHDLLPGVYLLAVHASGTYRGTIRLIKD